MGGGWLPWIVATESPEMKAGSPFMAHGQLSYRSEAGSWVDQLQWNAT